MEKIWLRSGSTAHSAFRKVVLQDTLLWDTKKLTGFHHTGSLEVFHSLLLSTVQNDSILAMWECKLTLNLQY